MVTMKMEQVFVGDVMASNGGGRARVKRVFPIGAGDADVMRIKLESGAVVVTMPEDLVDVERTVAA